MLQVRNLDFSYGPVQVLFDVDLEVQRGEVLALLGTNGAGKSTLLRAISGLGIPDRGVVRLNGRTLTYVDAELRFRRASCSSAAARACSPSSPSARTSAPPLLARSLEPAPSVQARIDRGARAVPGARPAGAAVAARDLSGGQQQMLALAMALVHEPEILLIDELSLGLAPVVVAGAARRRRSGSRPPGRR